MSDIHSCGGNIIIKLASSEPERLQAYALRYRIFQKEQLFEIPMENHREKLEYDAYDEGCEHLIAQDKTTQEVIATLRFHLSPKTEHKAAAFFAESQFDMRGVLQCERDIVEIGRLCIDPRYKSRNIFILFRKELIKYAHRALSPTFFLFGLCSVPYALGHQRLSGIYRFLQSCMVPRRLSMDALPIYRFEPVAAGEEEHILTLKTLPPLLRIYMLSGAQLLGTPGVDRENETMLSAMFPLGADISEKE